MQRRRLALVVTCLAVLCACSSAGDEPVAVTTAADREALAERLRLIHETVLEWGEASSMAEAHRLAETAANLIVGPGGPGYGDRDGDGAVGGATTEGLLPGLEGDPAGLAMGVRGNPCIRRDVLGGGWDDPQGEWQSMNDAIVAWEPGNNTMPTLPSHPMRVVGWATFTIDSDALELAHEYASHARIHSGLSLRAVDC